jgi:hypothetical protein
VAAVPIASQTRIKKKHYATACPSLVELLAEKDLKPPAYVIRKLLNPRFKRGFLCLFLIVKFMP